MAALVSHYYTVLYQYQYHDREQEKRMDDLTVSKSLKARVCVLVRLTQNRRVAHTPALPRRVMPSILGADMFTVALCVIVIPLTSDFPHPFFVGF